jgi:hypothetical protein
MSSETRPGAREIAGVNTIEKEKTKNKTSRTTNLPLSSVYLLCCQGMSAEMQFFVINHQWTLF